MRAAAPEALPQVGAGAARDGTLRWVSAITFPGVSPVTHSATMRQTVSEVFIRPSKNGRTRSFEKFRESRDTFAKLRTRTSLTCGVEFYTF